MFETNIVIVGNVLTAPEWRRTNTKGTLLAHFRVASTARRLDKETGRWVDGDSLRVRVTCWRKLAEGVGASIAVGDPVPALADFDGDFSGHGDSRSAADDDLSPVGGEMEIEIEALGGESVGRRRARRAGRRQPVPA